MNEDIIKIRYAEVIGWKDGLLYVRVTSEDLKVCLVYFVPRDLIPRFVLATIATETLV